MVIVLCYHKVSNIRNDYNTINVTPDNFRCQMEYLKKRYRIIPLSDIYKETFEDSTPNFAITFDDGYSDVFYEALPILEEFNIPATAFITTGNVGTVNENWTDNIIRAIFEPQSKRDYFECRDDELTGRWRTGTLEEKTAFYRKVNYLFRHIGAQKRYRYETMLLEWAGLSHEGRKDRRILSFKELKRLSESPLISIGAHCVTHPSLGSLTDEEQESEIVGCIEALSDITNLNIKYMAYPFGSRSDYNDKTIELLHQNGIDMAFTTLNEIITDRTDPYQIPRIVMGNYDVDDFKRVIDNIIDTQIKSRSSVINEKTSIEEVPYYTGSIERDFRLLNGDKKIIVWGFGFWGSDLYNDLKLLNLHTRVVAFGDNDMHKLGKKVEGIPVLSKSDIAEKYNKKELVILIKNSHDLEIYDDLKKSGFQEIHLITK